MPKKLVDVVIWKARALPGQRVIPPHLKLAILSRGRIHLPVSNVMWLVEGLAETQGVTWVKRLRKPLPEIFAELPVTIELFWKQRASMTEIEIQEAVNGYLTLRRKQHLPQCFYILWTWTPHAELKKLEQLLDLDLTRLYSKPRVSVPTRDRDRYLLVVYVCILNRVVHYLRPAVPQPPLPPAQAMPPLEGLTAGNVERNLRTQPSLSATILGDQDGDVQPVRVLNKAKADGLEWLEIELLSPLRVKKAGKQISLPCAT